MLKTEAIAKLRQITASLETLEMNSQSVKEQFDKTVGCNQNLREKAIGLLLKTRPHIHQLDKLAYFFSAETEILKDVKLEAMRCNRLVSLLSEIEKNLVRRDYQVDVAQMSKDKIESQIRCYRNHQHPESKVYLEVLRARLQEIEAFESEK